MKSKELKRKEAIERARAIFPSHQEKWLRYQPGGDIYEKTKKHSPIYAEELRKEAQVSLEEAAARAGVDLHGNPLI